MHARQRFKRQSIIQTQDTRIENGINGLAEFDGERRIATGQNTKGRIMQHGTFPKFIFDSRARLDPGFNPANL